MMTNLERIQNMNAEKAGFEIVDNLFSLITEITAQKEELYAMWVIEWLESEVEE